MKDFVPKGTGNSRFLKSVSNFKSLYPTYDDFVLALVSGTLPIDFNGMNPDGYTQLGTPLNKAALLSDSTAASLLMRQEDPTVSEAFDAVNKLKKRTVRFVVGTNTSNWTQTDCDYLCDGINDEEEIKSAIADLPENGGEIVLLDGVYYISKPININKDNVRICGNGDSTSLYRTNGFPKLINITRKDCTVVNLSINGNNSSYPAASYAGIYCEGENCIISNVKFLNTNKGVKLNGENGRVTNCVFSDYVGGKGIAITIEAAGAANQILGNNIVRQTTGIYDGGTLSVIANNIVTNSSFGISLHSLKPSATGNACENNEYNMILDAYYAEITGNRLGDFNVAGIQISNSLGCVISGNSIFRGTGSPSDYSSTQYTIQLQGTSNQQNLISNNLILGKNYVSEGGTSNTFVNNKYS